MDTPAHIISQGRVGTHLSCNSAQPCAPPGSGLSTQLTSRIFSEPNFVCFNIYTPFPRSRFSRKTLYFLFLAVTRKYAFPLRPLANQNQSAFQHLFQTDLGRSFPHELAEKSLPNPKRKENTSIFLRIYFHQDKAQVKRRRQTMSPGTL